MADALEPCTFMDGDNVVIQGDEGEDFFIVVEVQLTHAPFVLWQETLRKILLDLGLVCNGWRCGICSG